MKLCKSLFLILGLSVCSQAPLAQAMEFGVETVPYVAQDMYEQIPEYVIPGIGIATLAGTCYVLHQISSGIDRALNNFTKNSILRSSSKIAQKKMSKAQYSKK